MKTFLRSHLGSNLLLPQSGFALINSIMSLFDVELDKTQWEHPPPRVIRPPPSNKASYYEWHWRQPVEGLMVGQSAAGPRWFSSYCPSSDPPPSVNGLHQGRIFLVRCPLLWRPITSFWTVCQHTNWPCTKSFSKGGLWHERDIATAVQFNIFI